MTRTQAKQPADDLVASKKELDAQVEAQRKAAKEFEIQMRRKAITVGNIVGKDVPVSQTEVREFLFSFYGSLLRELQDENALLRTWHPDGPNATFEKKKSIMPHHEVLLRLDAMDLDRGLHSSMSYPPVTNVTYVSRCQSSWSPRILLHKRWDRSQSGVDFVWARLLTETWIQKNPTAIHDE